MSTTTNTRDDEADDLIGRMLAFLRPGIEQQTMAWIERREPISDLLLILYVTAERGRVRSCSLTDFVRIATALSADTGTPLGQSALAVAGELQAHRPGCLPVVVWFEDVSQPFMRLAWIEPVQAAGQA